MVRITAKYLGDLHCELTHGPSGSNLHTDAPKDNQGKGEAFSPTDLSAASWGSCMLTVMGIEAKKKGMNIEGAFAEVEKEMVADPVRRIAKISVKIGMPKGLSKEDRAYLENAARHCPVAESYAGSRIETPVSFSYSD